MYRNCELPSCHDAPLSDFGGVAFSGAYAKLTGRYR
jgi:hypothetical protein